MPEPARIEDLKRDLNPRRKIAGYDETKAILNEVETLHKPDVNSAIYQQNSTVMDINFAFLKNQARYFCVYSPQPLGIGKTSYSLQCLRQLYGEYDYNGDLVALCNDWEKLKTHIVFHPQTFKQILQRLISTRTRIKALVWDDSGIYLASKDWSKSWAKEIVKYFQLARTYCASIILTTPSPSLILKDIRRLNMVTVEIQSLSKFQLNENSARKAISYDHWYLPDLTKPRVRKRAQDYFNVMLPDNIFYPYSLMRDGYSNHQLEKSFKVIGNDGLDMVGSINYEKLAPIRA